MGCGSAGVTDEGYVGVSVGVNGVLARKRKFYNQIFPHIKSQASVMLYKQKIENISAHRKDLCTIEHTTTENTARFFDKLTLIIVNRHTIEYNERRKRRSSWGVRYS